MKTHQPVKTKHISLGLAAAALLAAAPLSATTSLAGPFDALRGGSLGQGGHSLLEEGLVEVAFSAEVQRIQRRLNRLGYDAGPEDGLIGARTRNAIRDYQRDNDLLVTGQPSSSLAQHLQDNVREMRAERNNGTQAQAATSTEAEIERQTVLQLQSDLRRLGYSIPVVTGTVDSATAEAIRAYQKDNNLLVDGRLSRELVAHVQGKTSAGMVIEDRDTVRKVQQALNERGYDAGPADGIMGSKTRDAIRTFQSDASLPLSGTISQDTLVQLGLAAGAAGAAASEQAEATPDQDGGPVTVIADNFSDGDYLRNPRWEVVAGTWRVTDGSALSSEVPITRSAAPQKLGPDMLKDILGGALGVQTQQQSLAAIHTRGQLDNAFRLNLRLSASGQPAVLNLGPYQGTNVGYGYRLEARTGESQPLHLLAITSTGTTVIGSSDVDIRFDDGSKHTLDWRRESSGLHTIEFDGRVVLQVLDKTFQDPFNGISLVNAGGSWSIDDIEAQSLGR